MGLDVELSTMREICCKFLLPGGSIGQKYVLQLYLVKNNKFTKNSTTTNAREDISTDLES
jgi:hypothetical protein